MEAGGGDARTDACVALSAGGRRYGRKKKARERIRLLTRIARGAALDESRLREGPPPVASLFYSTPYIIDAIVFFLGCILFLRRLVTEINHAMLNMIIKLA